MSNEKSPSFIASAGVPADIPPGNIAELFFHAVDTFRKPDALKYKAGEGWQDISHQKVYEDVKCLSAGLESLGIEAGDRVAILAENRPEWLLADFACVTSLAISVPLYPVLPAEQIEYQLRNSEARVIFVSSDEQLQKVRRLKPRSPALELAIVFDREAAGSEPWIRTFDEVIALGREAADGGSDAEYRERALATEPDEVLTIIYTSGTTGRPKGVMLTHNNLVSNVRGALRCIDINPSETALSVLPLSHVFERMAGHYVMFAAGATIAYAGSFDTVGEDMLAVRPTLMALVPRGYEKIVERVEEVARQGGPLKEKLLSWAREVGKRWVGRKLESGEEPGLWLSAQHRIVDRLVFRKLRARTGGRIKLFISGGAPLNPDLARFFLAADLTLLEGYGLTETSPVIALNRPDSICIGTVGSPLPGVEVAIAADREILTRGPHVMKGYFKDPEATAAAIDGDAWFHTGDIGELDEDGYLSITDRKKDLIVTAGGKNIAPQPIENRTATNPYVRQVVMIGDRRRFPILVIAPNFDALESWARDAGIEFETREELVRNGRVREFMEHEILDTLSDFPRHEQPKKIALLHRELSIETGEITPTLKVKRRVIEEKYSDLIEPLYRDG